MRHHFFLMALLTAQLASAMKEEKPFLHFMPPPPLLSAKILGSHILPVGSYLPERVVGLLPELDIKTSTIIFLELNERIFFHQKYGQKILATIYTEVLSQDKGSITIKKSNHLRKKSDALGKQISTKEDCIIVAGKVLKPSEVKEVIKSFIAFQEKSSLLLEINAIPSINPFSSDAPEWESQACMFHPIFKRQMLLRELCGFPINLTLGDQIYAPTKVRKNLEGFFVGRDDKDFLSAYGYHLAPHEIDSVVEFYRPGFIKALHLRK